MHLAILLLHLVCLPILMRWLSIVVAEGDIGLIQSSSSRASRMSNITIVTMYSCVCPISHASVHPYEYSQALCKNGTANFVQIGPVSKLNPGVTVGPHSL